MLECRKAYGVTARGSWPAAVAVLFQSNSRRYFDNNVERNSGALRARPAASTFSFASRASLIGLLRYSTCFATRVLPLKDTGTERRAVPFLPVTRPWHSSRRSWLNLAPV